MIKMDVRIYYQSLETPSEYKFRDLKPTLSYFLQYWRMVYLKEFKKQPDLNMLYSMFNDYEINPLSDENNGQNVIKSTHTHTSMSVGDIIQLDKDFYIVAGAGFDKIEF